jgi:hypothetical protein
MRQWCCGNYMPSEPLLSVGFSILLPSGVKSDSILERLEEQIAPATNGFFAAVGARLASSITPPTQIRQHSPVPTTPSRTSTAHQGCLPCASIVAGRRRFHLLPCRIRQLLECACRYINLLNEYRAVSRTRTRPRLGRINRYRSSVLL